MSDEEIPVRVALRVRPLINSEIESSCIECISVVAGRQQILIGKDKAFTYDTVWGGDTIQNEFYETCVKDIVLGCLEGYNGTVLAYGQTGSGKTYTMGSGALESMFSIEEADEKKGVIPRVFETISEHMTHSTEYKYDVYCSFLEIHKEDIYDLLSPHDRTPLNLRETSFGEIIVSGLQERQVDGIDAMMNCLEEGSALRTTSATNMNSTSSRSHAIFSIKVHATRIDKETGLVDDQPIHMAKLHLVDLAGSERLKRTGAEGKQMKEGISINCGLLALGNVISSLADQAKKEKEGVSSHVPYRDSKLTRLLQDSLGGNSRTLMIACVSPADTNVDESTNTLRYADRARQIKNKPIVNIDPQEAKMQMLRDQITLLKLQVNAKHGDIPIGLESNNSVTRDLKRKVLTLENDNIALNEALAVQTLRADEAAQERDRLRIQMKAYLEKHSINPEDILQSHHMEELDLADKYREKINKLESELLSVKRDTTKNDVEDVDEVKYNNNTKSERTSEDRERILSEDGEREEPDEIDEEYMQRHCASETELAELSAALAYKEDLVEKLMANDAQMGHMKKHYESQLKKFEQQVKQLQTEKENLAKQMAGTSASTDDKVLRDNRAYKQRVKQLEEELNDLYKKQKAITTILNMKKDSELQMKSLQDEIALMKKHKVDLMKKMKEESQRYRLLREAKEKEIKQLRKKNLSHANELSKIKITHSKQAAFMKRKAEEAAAVSKRLKDQLDKKVSVEGERNRSHLSRQRAKDNHISLRSNEEEKNNNDDENDINNKNNIEERVKNSLQYINLKLKLDFAMKQKSELTDKIIKLCGDTSSTTVDSNSMDANLISIEIMNERKNERDVEIESQLNKLMIPVVDPSSSSLNSLCNRKRPSPAASNKAMSFTTRKRHKLNEEEIFEKENFNLNTK